MTTAFQETVDELVESAGGYGRIQSRAGPLDGAAAWPLLMLRVADGIGSHVAHRLETSGGQGSHK